MHRTNIGIIGAGNIGGTLARLLVGIGYEVRLANSRGPATLAGLVDSLGPRARAVTLSEAASEPLVIEAIPFGRLESLPRAELSGKIVVTAANYYPGRDGVFDTKGRAQSYRLVDHVPDARVVKTFNTIWFKHLAEQGDVSKPLEERRCIPVAGDDPDAVQRVADLVAELGFGPLVFDRLAASQGILEPDGALYNLNLTLAEARSKLASLRRPV
jgi:predicted dinucleotide-binding enzyme